MSRYYYDNQGDVTKRELLFCIALFILLMFLGFFIASSIRKYENDDDLMYNQAVQITDQGEFEQAFDTNIGHAFVDGMFTCDGVTYDKITGRYLKIDVMHQRYTKHTRVETYTTTDSKGRTHTHTRTVTYWSWDTIGGFENHCQTVQFKGKTFSYGNFNYGTVPCSTETVRTGINHRDVVTTYPRQFYCTVFCNMIYRSFYDVATIYYEKNIEQAHKTATTHFGVPVFWMLWIAFSVLMCVCFAKQRNEWLEDNQ